MATIISNTPFPAEIETRIRIAERHNVNDFAEAQRIYPIVAKLFALDVDREVNDPGRFAVQGTELDIEFLRDDVALITLPVSIQLTGDALTAFLADLKGDRGV